MRHLLLFALLTCCIGSCDNEVEPAEAAEHLLIREDSQSGYIKMHLTWTVNGVPDDGMVADVSIYLSESKEGSENVLDKGIENVIHSAPDPNGGEFFRPSFSNETTSKCLNCSRFFVGVAFNGIYPGAEAVDYPLVVAYNLSISRENSAEEELVIKGKFVIDEAGQEVTLVEYQYSLDRITTGNEKDYFTYSFRRLPKKLSVFRPSDMVETEIVSANLPLTASLVWKVTDENKGFEDVDLDLVLHDIARSISDPTQADRSGASTGSYEVVRLEKNSGIFVEGIPEKIGFYFSGKTASGSSPVTVRYLLKLYSYQSNSTRRYLYFGSFTSPPVAPGSGTYYFPTDLVLGGDVYQASTWEPVFTWEP